MFELIAALLVGLLVGLAFGRSWGRNVRFSCALALKREGTRRLMALKPKVEFGGSITTDLTRNEGWNAAADWLWNQVNDYERSQVRKEYADA